MYFQMETIDTFDFVLLFGREIFLFIDFVTEPSFVTLRTLTSVILEQTLTFKLSS